MNPIDVTILIPCLNEERTIAYCVEQALNMLDSSGISGEVLVVDNGSRDASATLAAAAGARVVLAQRPGYGNALRMGIMMAKGKYIVMGDADGTYDFTEALPLVDQLKDGASIALGNRFQHPMQPNAMKPLHRYFGNPLFSALVRLFFRNSCRDVYCGLRGFSRPDILKLHLTSEGMEFALEMVLRASLSGMKISEVPVTLKPSHPQRNSHLKTWRDGAKGMILLFSMLYKKIFGDPFPLSAPCGSVG